MQPRSSSAGRATLIALLVGSFPRLGRQRRSHRDLQRGSRRTGGGHRRTRSAAGIAEIALALCCSSFRSVAASLQHLFCVRSASSRLACSPCSADRRARFSDDEASDRFFAGALDAVRRVPGVTEAALTSQLPLSGDRDEYGVFVESSPQGNNSFRYAVTPRYLETMRIPLRRGRFLDERDAAGAPLAAMISESFAARSRGASDRHAGDDRCRYTIVGVVGM